jgi:predicted DNA-binding transcriptional regulator AlpA
MDKSTARTRVLRMKDLPTKVGLRPSTIYELISYGKFPASFKLVSGGRASGWLETTIDAWLEERSTNGGGGLK